VGREAEEEEEERGAHHRSITQRGDENKKKDRDGHDAEGRKEGRPPCFAMS